MSDVFVLRKGLYLTRAKQSPWSNNFKFNLEWIHCGREHPSNCLAELMRGVGTDTWTHTHTIKKDSCIHMLYSFHFKTQSTRCPVQKLHIYCRKKEGVHIVMATMKWLLSVHWKLGFLSKSTSISLSSKMDQTITGKRSPPPSEGYIFKTSTYYSVLKFWVNTTCLIIKLLRVLCLYSAKNRLEIKCINVAVEG